MRYKDDWELAKKRHAAFWNRDIIDRCCVSIQVPDRNLYSMLGRYSPRNDEDIFTLRTDPELIIEKNRLIMEHTYYRG